MARADVLLTTRGLFPSRAKAREAIAAGLVRANGRIVLKPSEALSEDVHIEANAPYPWVSRGGVKLAAALEIFDFNPKDLLCLDVGASTGGFTDVLLHAGARRVVAVDVGEGQFHPRLRADPRVKVLEKTDARRLTRDIAGAPELIVCDVSFISLSLVLPPVLALSAPGACLAALIKPQFEAGPAAVKKGVVRDAGIHQAVIEKISHLIVNLGWRVLKFAPSPISGGDGNLEFLIGARRI